MNIVIIGTGNTATVLGKMLKLAGHCIVQILGRHQPSADALAKALNAEPVSDPATINRSAGLYLLAVPDNVVEEVAASLPLTGNTVVHTAASVPLLMLEGKARHYGVLYPLQSLKKEVRQLPEIPVLIDASDGETLDMLRTLAAGISKNVFVANDEQRIKMHLAAVMVNNFTNHLFALVEAYCREEALDFSLLLPLIKETVSRLDEIKPSQAQTGPAVRNDTKTLEKHLALLEKTPDLKKFYVMFTESIQQSRK
jgi:predicted short-subunit dehydrogenase-like oxidoreductase (DUF2520 family)